MSATTAVSDLLDEIRELGAEVVTRERGYSDADITGVEEQLGFDLPGEYREFLAEYGHIEIELERTWFFYGLEDGQERTDAYQREFDRAISSGVEPKREGPYFPRKFFVLADEGDFSNPASGVVYDHDLEAMIVTRGAASIEASDALAVGYWGFLLDELAYIRDRIDDPEDVLVAGSDREVELQEHERRAEPKTREQTRALEQLDDAVERLYEVFGTYPRERRERYCWKGVCPDCEATNDALNEKPLRELTRKDLFHYAYFALNESIEPDDVWGERIDEFKHFLPRIFEIIDVLGMLGNPSVVLKTLVGKLALVELSEDETAAIRGFLEAQWKTLLHSGLTDAEQLRHHLRAYAKICPSLEAFLEIWGESSTVERPVRHAAEFIADHDFSKDAGYYGWSSVETAYEEICTWLLSTDVRGALELERRRVADSSAEELFEKAIETVRLHADAQSEP